MIYSIELKKLSIWAKENGIHYQTAWLWFKKGILPVDAIQLPTGTILVKEKLKIKEENEI
jgi:putative resolvase